jgi:hypothetical protein
MATLSMADMFEGRMNDLVEHMRDTGVNCYEGSDGVHYIQFGDGSVIVDPDLDALATFDVNEWHDFENADHITECDGTTEDEQGTVLSKATIQ